jgi:hypothetical protein
MSQVLGDKGVCSNGMTFTLKANDIKQQVQLNNGYMTLLDDKWPQPTNAPTTYDYCLRLQHQGRIMEIIPNLIVQDYRGGILDFGTDNDVADYKRMIRSFSESVAIVYIVDGNSLLAALEPEERDVVHSNRNIEIKESIYAKQQMSIVENLFVDFKRTHSRVPPIMVAISKDDVLTPNELDAGKKLIKGVMPSIFGHGSGTISAITHFSLGVDLEKGIQSSRLKLNTERNLHIPVMFSAYAEFCQQYEVAPNDGVRRALSDMMLEMRNIFRGRLDIFIDGERAIEV